ncbi:hypothetical protein D3C87_820800 [compost metagenome]
MTLVLQDLDSPHQQLFLLAVAGFKFGLPGMDSDQPTRTGTVLVVPSAQAEDEPMGIRLRAPVDVVDQDIEIADTVDTAGHAANVLTQSIVEPLLSG